VACETYPVVRHHGPPGAEPLARVRVWDNVEVIRTQTRLKPATTCCPYQWWFRDGLEETLFACLGASSCRTNDTFGGIPSIANRSWAGISADQTKRELLNMTCGSAGRLGLALVLQGVSVF
jgi:hypothetical protein